MKGWGKESPHRGAKRDEDALPELHMDYCFPASEGQEGVTILVGKERDSKMVVATVVPEKGTVGDVAAKRMKAFLRDIGVWGAAP